MQSSKILTTAMALGVVAIIGLASGASAYPGNHGWGGQGMMTQEQQAAAQEIYGEYNKSTAPLRQELMAKRAELNTLYYGQNPDSAKTEALFQEIAKIEAKLFNAEAAVRAKLADKGIDCPGNGMHMGYAGNGGSHHGMHRGHGGYGGHRGAW